MLRALKMNRSESFFNYILEKQIYGTPSKYFCEIHALMRKHSWTIGHIFHNKFLDRTWRLCARIALKDWFTLELFFRAKRNPVNVLKYSMTFQFLMKLFRSQTTENKAWHDIHIYSREQHIPFDRNIISIEHTISGDFVVFV